MRRTAILTVLVILTACRKPEGPMTTSSASPAGAPRAAAAIAKAYVPPADVNVAGAPVPTKGLSLWLRADAGVTTGPEGKVSSWAVEGSTVKAVAASPDAQPGAEENTIGGMPSIHFDGAANMLEANLNVGPEASPQLTVISVFSSETGLTSPQRKLYGADPGGYGRAAGLDSRAGDKDTYTIFGGSAGVIAIFKLAANTPYLTVDSYDQSRKLLNVWVNGAPAKQNVPIDHGSSLTKFYIGGTGTAYHEPWLGSVAEMLVYRRMLTDDERKKVEDYLAGKYALKLTRL